jgi:hypothetical protein
MRGIMDIEVLHNLRDGDVLWLQVHNGTSSEEVDAIHAALEEVLSTETTIIVTNKALVESIQVMPLADLLLLQEQIGTAVGRRMADTSVEV